MKNLSLILFTTFLLTACSHTFNGMGEDMQDWGRAISGASGSPGPSSPAKQPVNDPNMDNGSRY